MLKKIIYFFSSVLLILLALAQPAFTQSNTVLDSAAIYNMSLEELMNIKSSGVSSELEALVNSLIGVASKKPLSARKSPSIVTLITQEEIEKSGARDLIDVLRLVPGIDFGSDVNGVVGIAMRGNWANEGKVLLLLDGQEMNEILYSTLQFGNHFDVSQIKRIEIIRGPGSAIYGGFAEYGVISIITKDGEDLNGISANVSAGQMVNDLGHRNLTISGGKKIGDLNFSLAGFIGEGQRSDRTYTDFTGQSYSMMGSSYLDPGNINFGLSYKKFSVRAIYDDYRTTNQDNYGTAVSQPYHNDFRSTLIEAKYDLKLNDKITITPRFNFKEQMPWNYTGTPAPVDASSYTVYDKTADRYKGNVTMLYDVTNKFNIVAGAEMYYDKASMGIDSAVFSNGKRTIDYTNSALFFQALLKSRIAGVTIGARYDNNSAYGSAFVPRIGITKKIDNLAFKLLYSNSFRAPGIENIDKSPNNDIKPEMTQVVEFETSYQLTPNMIITLNVFDMLTKNPIVYFVDTTKTGDQDSYKNMNQLGSNGVEAEYRIKSAWGYLNFNYSYYSVAGKNIVDYYQVPTNNSMALAFPANKFNLSVSYNINSSLSITPTLSWLGKRYGYAPDSLNGSVLKEFSPSLLANIFVSYNDLLFKGFKLGVGCYNIFDDAYAFLQPYNGGHAPLPAQSREVVVRLTYKISAKKHS